jgi:hypothetical protein
MIQNHAWGGGGGGAMVVVTPVGATVVALKEWGSRLVGVEGSREEFASGVTG